MFTFGLFWFKHEISNIEKLFEKFNALVKSSLWQYTITFQYKNGKGSRLIPCHYNMSLNLPNVKFRQYQVQTLSAFISSNHTHSVPHLFLQGYESTGKTYTITRFFECNPQLISVTLRPEESVTWKLLIQSMARSIQYKLCQIFPNHELQLKQLDPLSVEEPFHLINFLTKMFQLLSNESKQIFIIFDGLDNLQDIDATLLLKFLKLNELLSHQFNNFKLKMIYLIRDATFMARYSTFNIPTIIFPRYTYVEILNLLILIRFNDLYDDLLEHLKQEHIIDSNEDDNYSIIINFITLIVQSFQMYTGNNLNDLNDLLDLKWDNYLSNIDNTNYNDPITIYKKSIHIFNATNDTLTTDAAADDDNDADGQEKVESSTSGQTYELSNIAKYLLIAAYFCSYIETKYDTSIFSRKANIKSGRSSYGRRKKMETNPRHLQPSIFQLERLFAIFQAIYPMESAASSGSLQSLLDERLMKTNVEVFQNLSELHSLKLISTTTTRSIDFLSYKTKWKVNTPWEIIHEIASSVDFDIAQYFSGVSDY